MNHNSHTNEQEGSQMKYSSQEGSQMNNSHTGEQEGSQMNNLNHKGD
jgi:hypothetical protein